MKIQLSDHFTYGKLLRFTLPSIIMMIFTSIYGVVDGIFVSNFAGKTSFAAINLIMPYLMIFGTLGFMIGTGGTALISMTLGMGDQKKANSLFSMLTYVCILLFVIMSIFMYKTRFGLRLRACGEHPQAADSVGINVYKMRYAGTTISGALAGMGGFVYSLTTANCTAHSSSGLVRGANLSTSMICTAKHTAQSSVRASPAASVKPSTAHSRYRPPVASTTASQTFSPTRRCRKIPNRKRIGSSSRLDNYS